jgi:PAS domain S-box-containing protein
MMMYADIVQQSLDMPTLFSEEVDERDQESVSKETERLKTQLAAAQQLLDTLVERNPDGLLIADEEGTVRFASERAGALLGRSQDSLVGSPIGFPIAATGNAEIEVLAPSGRPRVLEMHVGRTTWEGEPAWVISVRDITERKGAQQQVRFQAQLLDAVEEAVIAIDVEGHVIYWNHFADIMYGWSAAEAVGRALADLLIPLDQVEAFRTDILRQLKNGQSWSGEIYVKHRDGTVFPVLTTSSPIHDSDGRLIGSVSVSKDISRRKEMEAILRASEERFRLLAENAQDIIYRLRLAPTQKFEYVSPSATAITGYTPEDHYANPNLGFELVHPEDRHLLAAIAQGSFPEEPIVLRWVRKDGSVIWTEQQNVPIYDEEGTLVAIEGIARDITKRKLTEVALQEANNRLIDILESISDGFFALDHDLKVTYFNKAAADLLNRSVDEVLGEDLFAAFPEAQGSIFDEQYRWALEHQEFVSFEIYFGAEPYRNWYNVRAYPYAGGLSVFFQVTTERKTAEEALIRQARELERSNAELQQFAYAASHDLREPLRAVTGFLELLEQRYAPQLDERAHEYIGFAVDGAHHMRELIDGLLAFSQVSSDGREMTATDTEMTVQHVLTDLGPVIEETNATITYDELPVVMAERVLLRQIFQNLISNALKFRSAEAPCIHISAERENGEWHFAVSDNGIGIPSDQADRIFLIFQRLHTRDEYPGAGIGLAICKKIVEHHGGRIWVESDQERGSTFHFTIPEEEGDVE